MTLTLLAILTKWVVCGKQNKLSRKIPKGTDLPHCVSGSTHAWKMSANCKLVAKLYTLSGIKSSDNLNILIEMSYHALSCFSLENSNKAEHYREIIKTFACYALKQCNWTPKSKAFYSIMLPALVNFKLNLYLIKPVFALILAFREMHFKSIKNALFLNDQNVQYLLGFFWLK